MARLKPPDQAAYFPDRLAMLAPPGIHARMHGSRARADVPIDVSALCGVVVPSLLRRTGGALTGPEFREPGIERVVSLLLDEHSHAFEAHVLDIADESGDPQRVAYELLAPSARLIGDYWRMDICDFMKVTVAMARIQRLFYRVASLYQPSVSLREGRTALLAPLPGEQHSFGLSIIDDALRRAGWQVDCCGVEEEEAYFDLLAANHYAVIGISLSGVALSGDLRGFLAKSRRRSRNASVRIVLGGSLVVEKPQLATDAGSDFVALSASSAVSVAEKAAWQQRGS